MTEEDKLQCAVAELLDTLGWQWSHSPLEGRRNPRTGALLKKKGMKRGVPDVMIYESWSDEHPLTDSWMFSFGVAIELKIGRNKPTTDQCAWLDALEQRGWKVATCRTMAEVQHVLRCVRPLNGRRLR